MRLLFAIFIAANLAGCATTEHHRDLIEPRSDLESIAPSKKNDGAIVFIHGLYGGTETWKNPSGSSWPALMRTDADFRNYDIYVPTYTTGCGTQLSIHQTAMNLHKQLKTDDVLNHKKVAIVAHSMGGLVAKDLVLAMSADDRARVSTVFLLGTPSQGAPLAPIVNLFCPKGSAKDLTTIDDNGYLQRLEDDWQRAVRQARRGNGEFPDIYCAYETKRTLGFDIVPLSRFATICDDDLLPIDTNHVELVKPQSRDSLQYKWVKRILQTAPTSSYCPQQEFPGGIGSSGWVLVGRYSLFKGEYVSEPRFEFVKGKTSRELPATDDLIRARAPLRVIIRGFSNTPPKDLENAIKIPPKMWGSVNYAEDFTGKWICKGELVEIRQIDIPSESDPIANVWARVAYPRK